MKDRSVAWAGTLLVGAHALVNVGHAVAHRELGIQMSSWQGAYILIVIGASPIVAAALLWSAYSRFGVLFLAGAMGAALVFGIYYHYIAISPDHVAHLPPGERQGLFRATALLLVVFQVMGVAVGPWGFRRLRGAS